MSQVISLIIPTYNERENIVPLVERIHRAMSNYDYQILLIDDDSPDGTAEVAANLSPRYPVRVIVRRNKRGLASAVVDGLRISKGEIIGALNADLQHPPEVIPDLLREIENGADIAIASRYVKGGRCQDWGLTRRIISRGATALAHLLLPSTRRFTDPMSGFYMLRKSVIANADLRPTGYKILLEILLEGKFHQVAEVAYTFGSRRSGYSKLGIRQYIDYLRHIFRLMKRKGELLRFIKFCAVGASGILVNMGLLWLLTEFAGIYYLVSGAIAKELSIVSNFTLNDFSTFRDRRLPAVSSFFSRLLKFNLVSIAGLVINIGVLWLLSEVFGIYYLISNLFGIMLATLFRYALSLWWTWR